jgi:hypothetical protein
VPAVLLARVYQLWHWSTGLAARGDPAGFCTLMTLASSGLAYVLAVVGVYVFSGRLRLGLAYRLLLTVSFALATVALPYARHVNNHILLLAVVAWLTVDVAALAEETGPSGLRWQRLLRLGFLSGLAYTIDLGAGPVILCCTGLLVMVRWRRGAAVVAFGLTALPWLALHHTLNYAVGGSWRPANAFAEYFDWPGSPFQAGNLTGGWAHSGPGSFLLYAASMLFGKRGFVGHSLPLFLVFPAAWMLLKERRRQPEVLWALACFAGTWVLYAAASNNSSGMCLSIRWFVPLLAPAYFLIGLWLRRYPQSWMQFAALSGWGFVLMLGMGEGPWSDRMVRGFWLIQVGALLNCGVIHFYGQHVQSVAAAAQVEQGNSAPAGSAEHLQWATKSLEV